MNIQIDTAIAYARMHLNKKVRRIDIARAMWPKSQFPYNNLNNLESGRTQTVSFPQIEAVMRLTGVPLDLLLQ